MAVSIFKKNKKQELFMHARKISHTHVVKGKKTRHRF